METNTMGRVLTEATVENLQDLWDVQRGMLPSPDARRVVIADALVDTGATTLALPAKLIQQLGLRKLGSRSVRSSTGVGEAALYDAVRLTIQGRSCTVDVMEVPDDVPALIGQVPLELLDFVVDPGGQKLMGNPAHGGQHVLEAYWAKESK